MIWFRVKISSIWHVWQHFGRREEEGGGAAVTCWENVSSSGIPKHLASTSRASVGSFFPNWQHNVDSSDEYPFETSAWCRVGQGMTWHCFVSSIWPWCWIRARSCVWIVTNGARTLGPDRVDEEGSVGDENTSVSWNSSFMSNSSLYGGMRSSSDLWIKTGAGLWKYRLLEYRKSVELREFELMPTESGWNVHRIQKSASSDMPDDRHKSCKLPRASSHVTSAPVVTTVMSELTNTRSWVSHISITGSSST